MAFQIKLIQAATLGDLEHDINVFFNEAGEDARIILALAGGITYANDVYVAPISISAPHLRRFDVDDSPAGVPRFDQ